jgi:GNAT superfamily N-acetyltransferase
MDGRTKKIPPAATLRMASGCPVVSENAGTNITVRRAGASDLDLLVPLFDQYRHFYRQPSDVALARRFLLERLQ